MCVPSLVLRARAVFFLSLGNIGTQTRSQSATDHPTHESTIPLVWTGVGSWSRLLMDMAVACGGQTARGAFEILISSQLIWPQFIWTEWRWVRCETTESSVAALSRSIRRSHGKPGRFTSALHSPPLGGSDETRRVKMRSDEMRWVIWWCKRGKRALCGLLVFA